MAPNPRVLAFVAGGVMAASAFVVTKYEGYVPHVYADPIGVSTVCYGHTGKDIDKDKTYTKAECLKLLTKDLYEAAAGVEQCVRAPLTNNQKVALIDMVVNVGPTAFCRSTMLKKINEGQPKESWCPEFKRWVYAAGIKFPGLVRRRQEEFDLCMRPD